MAVGGQSTDPADPGPGAPALSKGVYNLLLQPASSPYARAWAVLTAVLALARVVALAFASADGPNQYTGRRDQAQYGMLLTEAEYWYLDTALMLPLAIDAIMKTPAIPPVS
ncbi:hypothetical protein B484DRAFT_398834 [Ochromonadaceae sp. CCMP2298]|nr:hypothetical protein B484DRAFT_398834 [Ochromonadaceae sp. CCMP2298]